MADGSISPPHKRQQDKAQTRAVVLAAAKHLFTTCRYEDVGIRAIASRAKMSTGAVFNNWPGKAALYKDAMGKPAPVDGPATRAAPDMLELLTEATTRLRDRQHPGWLERADKVIAAAGGGAS